LTPAPIVYIIKARKGLKAMASAKIIPNLLRKSKIVESYPNLKTLIEGWDPQSPVPADIQSVVDLLEDGLIEQVKHEWAVDRYSMMDVGKETVNCDLCGHGGVRYVYWLENKHTGARYACGSDCVEKYGLWYGGADTVDGGIKEMRKAQAQHDKAVKNAHWAANHAHAYDRIYITSDRAKGTQHEHAMAKLLKHFESHGHLSSAQWSKFVDIEQSLA
jgi:hypothetical protein